MADQFALITRAKAQEQRVRVCPYCNHERRVFRDVNGCMRDNFLMDPDSGIHACRYHFDRCGACGLFKLRTLVVAPVLQEAVLSTKHRNSSDMASALFRKTVTCEVCVEVVAENVNLYEFLLKARVPDDIKRLIAYFMFKSTVTRWWPMSLT